MKRGTKNTAIRFNNEGNVCYKNNQPKEAIQLYTKAIELVPDISHFYGNRGQAYYQLKMFPEAIADSQKALELDPFFWKGHVRAGKCHLRLGNLSEAQACFESVSEACPEKQEAVSVARFELERLQEVTQQLHLAQECFEKEEYGRCVFHTEALLSTMTHNVELCLMLCDAYCHLHRYEQASALVKKLKQRAQLTEGQRHRLFVVEMTALGAMTATTWGLKDRIQKHWNLQDAPPDVERPSLYDCLGVRPSSSQQEITEAYTAKSAQYHPMRQPESIDEAELDTVTCMYLDCTVSFIILMDAELREMYDLGISPHLILAEDVDPYILLCGLPSEGDVGPRCARGCVGVACGPVLAAGTGAAWLAQQLFAKVTGGAEDVAWAERKQSLLQRQRRHLLRSARERAAGGGPSP